VKSRFRSSLLLAEAPVLPESSFGDAEETADTYVRQREVRAVSAAARQDREGRELGRGADHAPALAQLAAVFGLAPAGHELRRKPRELAFAGRPGVVIEAPLSVREAGFSRPVGSHSLRGKSSAARLGHRRRLRAGANFRRPTQRRWSSVSLHPTAGRHRPAIGQAPQLRTTEIYRRHAVR
jgi:hypothetical protein